MPGKEPSRTPPWRPSGQTGPPEFPPGPPAPLTRKGAWEDQEGAHDEGKTGLKAQAKFGLLSIFRGPGFAAQWKFTKKWGGSGRPEASYLNNTLSNRGNFLLLYQTLSVR